jgi:phosphoglycolate phosphatase
MRAAGRGGPADPVGSRGGAGEGEGHGGGDISRDPPDDAGGDGPRRSRFELAIFDLDGTLVDSVPDIAWALNRTLAEEGRGPLTVAAVRELVGDGARELVARALAAPSPSVPRRASNIDGCLVRFVEHYRSHVAVETCLYPGIAALLETLSRTEGLVLAVLTNKPKPITTPLLTQLGIAGYFAAVIGDGDGFPHKPDPTAARRLIVECGTSAEHTVVIGDGLPDVRMAHAVGCASISVTWGYVSTDVLRAESPQWMASNAGDLERLLIT